MTIKSENFQKLVEDQHKIFSEMSATIANNVIAYHNEHCQSLPQFKTTCEANFIEAFFMVLNDVMHQGDQAATLQNFMGKEYEVRMQSKNNNSGKF